jgi:hypothetical protein
MKHTKNKFRVAVSLAAVLGMTISSCENKDGINDYKPTRPIGGYNSSSEIMPDALVAHWTFEAGSKEEKSGATAAAENNATYGAGKKGNAVNLNHGYLAFNEITALNTLPSYTISAWINIANNKGTAAEGASNIFTMTRDQSPTAHEWAGNINFMMENSWYGAASDTLLVKALNVTNVGGNASWQDSRNDPPKGGAQAFLGAKKWAHVVITWNGGNNKLLVYGNGQKISNPDWETRSGGPLTLFTPTRPIIGAWGTNVKGTPDGWQQKFLGSIDELRVYNVPLTASDVNSLYKLENLGR